MNLVDWLRQLLKKGSASLQKLFGTKQNWTTLRNLPKSDFRGGNSAKSPPPPPIILGSMQKEGLQGLHQKCIFSLVEKYFRLVLVRYCRQPFSETLNWPAPKPLSHEIASPCQMKLRYDYSSVIKVLRVVVLSRLVIIEGV